MTKSIWTWVVVADAHGARIFRFVNKTETWQLVECVESDGTGANGTSHFGSKASHHKGALHGHGEVKPKETRERHLAHALAHALEQGMVENTFGALALVAPPKLLGELRENLSRGLQEKIVAEFHRDYIHLDVAEISKRLLPDLPLTTPDAD